MGTSPITPSKPTKQAQAQSHTQIIHYIFPVKYYISAEFCRIGKKITGFQRSPGAFSAKVFDKGSIRMGCLVKWKNQQKFIILSF
jgi:hypothetical protein